MKPILLRDMHATDGTPPSVSVRPQQTLLNAATLLPAVLPLLSETAPSTYRLLDDVLAQLPEGVVILDANARPIRANAMGLASLAAKNLDELRNKGLGAYIHLSHRRAFKQALSHASQGIANTLELQLHHATDAMHWHELRLSPLGAWPGLDDKQAVICITRDISEQRRTADVIWRHSHFDRLTGLANRKTFQDHLTQAIARAEQNDTGLALILIDLNGLRDVNETLGFESGDTVLLEASRRIQASVSEGDFVARVAGDKFAVALTQLDTYGASQHLARALLRGLADPIVVGSETIAITASAGVTFFPSDARHAEVLLKNAEQALRTSKQHGRHHVAFYNSSMRSVSQSRMRLVADLRKAVIQNELQLYFQPIIEMASGRIVGAESLLRWQHPTQGMISPEVFIPLAEETGLILSIGDWVFREAAKWAKKWVALKEGSFYVAVNQSPTQFRDRLSVLGWLDHLKEIALPNEHMVIEITEGLLLGADGDIRTLLRHLQAAGIRLAIDDFGTGYSSLSYLHTFPVDTIKIDKSFVQEIQTQKSARTLSESIIAMAHKLEISVVAEGVETIEQHDILLGAGCNCAQGYLYSHPVNAEAFSQMLTDRASMVSSATCDSGSHK